MIIARHPMSIVVLLIAWVAAGGCELTPDPTGSFQDAIKQGDVEQVQRHLHWGIATPPRADTLLAASYGNAQIVQLLLEAGADICPPSRPKDTALHYAAGGGHDQVVRFLLEHGALVNARAPNAKTPLHWAAGRGHVGTVELLLDTGAEVNAVSRYGTPLRIAESENHVQVAESCCVDGGRGHKVKMPIMSMR